MLKLRGEDRADYFHVLCADCGEHVEITYLGTPGVPMIHARCTKCGAEKDQKQCGAEKDQKLMVPFWKGLPPDLA